MDFPARRSKPISPPPGLVAVGVAPLEIIADDFKYIALLESAQIVRDLAPNLAGIARMDRSGVIVTAPGDGVYDFVSRNFSPANGVPEDPVTGSAHCALAPFWASRLHKAAFRAFQASRRGGEIICRLDGDRVELQGTVVFYMEGEVEI
jgi:predicted PhzF superfamily epimerase YddE/YHI9